VSNFKYIIIRYNFYTLEDLNPHPKGPTHLLQSMTLFLCLRLTFFMAVCRRLTIMCRRHIYLYSFTITTPTHRTAFEYVPTARLSYFGTHSRRNRKMYFIYMTSMVYSFHTPLFFPPNIIGPSPFSS
jgi:hypothetical protein